MTGQPEWLTNQASEQVFRLVMDSQESSLLPPFTPLPSEPPSLRRLQRELEAAREEARNLQELLEELPSILERKFQLRLRALLQEQRQLEEENALLQQHLLALHGEEMLPSPAGLQPAPSLAANPESPITGGLGLRRALRLLHR